MNLLMVGSQVALLALAFWAQPGSAAVVRNESPSFDEDLSSSGSSGNPVCIIGAGPSGLTTAHNLESQGYSTVLFDSNIEVGGRCQSYYDDPEARTTYHAMGALIFTNQTYNDTLALIVEAGLPLTPALSPSAGWNYWQYGAPQDGGAMNVSAQPLPTDPLQIAAITAEVVRYTAWWIAEFERLYSGTSYTNGVPSGLTVPIADWLSTNGYIALPFFMEEGLVYEGYGDIMQTPAIYALQFFTPEILTYYIGTTPGYFVDFHKLFLWYAKKYVKGPIHSSTNVTRIDRSGTNPILTYSVPGASSPATQTCSKLVLAFPPTPRALEAAGLDFTQNETEVFSQVGVTAYWATAFTMDLPYPYAFLETPPTPDGGPIAMLRYFNESPIATAYSFGLSPYNGTPSDDEVRALLIQRANDLAKGVAAKDVGGETNPIEVSDADVKWFLRQDHFPHVLTDALERNFYDSYNKLQGQKKTYWTSGLNRFDNVESSIRAANDLVKLMLKQ